METDAITDDMRATAATLTEALMGAAPAPEPEPEPEPINRGVGFLPILVRQLAGIINLRVNLARAEGVASDQMHADLVAIKQLGLDLPSDAFSKSLQAKLSNWRSDVQAMMLTDLTFMGQQAFVILELLDLELVGLVSDGGTHP